MKLAVFLLTTAMALASDSFVGTWKANPVKTKAPDAKKSETLSIDDMGPDQYRVTRTTADGKNDTYGLTFDGKEHAGEAGSSAFGVRVGKRHLRNTLKGPNGTLVSEWIVSPDGRQLTNNRKGKGTVTGRPIDEVLVYDKQP